MHQDCDKGKSGKKYIFSVNRKSFIYFFNRVVRIQWWIKKCPKSLKTKMTIFLRRRAGRNFPKIFRFSQVCIKNWRGSTRALSHWSGRSDTYNMFSRLHIYNGKKKKKNVYKVIESHDLKRNLHFRNVKTRGSWRRYRTQRYSFLFHSIYSFFVGSVSCWRKR